MQLSVRGSQRACPSAGVSRRLRHAAHRPVWPSSSAQPCQTPGRACWRTAAAAGAQSSSETLQQQERQAPSNSKQQQQEGRPSVNLRAKRCKNPKKYYDLDFYHYMPSWLQPAPILAVGAAFFLLALVLDQGEPFEKTAVLAAGPVAMFYGVLLFLMPRLFRSFAVDYMRSHPEDPNSNAKRSSSEQ